MRHSGGCWKTVAGGWQDRGRIFCTALLQDDGAGTDEPSACICAGSHAADPHYTERLGCIERGNCLLMDFGGAYQGYYTDMTQTFWFDDPDPEFVPDS